MIEFTPHDPHYLAVRAFYGDRRAVRSKVPYINHIDEGIDILDMLRVTVLTKQAYCLHPIVQADSSMLAAAVNDYGSLSVYALDPRTIVLAMEYRAVANAYLSYRSISSAKEIQLSLSSRVNDMLRADKIQNRKDFDIYHKGTHPRSKELEQYFRYWFEALGITEEQYQRILASITRAPVQ